MMTCFCRGCNMEEITTHTQHVDGRNLKEPPFGCIKPCKQWDNGINYSLTGAGFLPSTVQLTV